MDASLPPGELIMYNIAAQYTDVDESEKMATLGRWTLHENGEGTSRQLVHRSFCGPLNTFSPSFG